METLKTYRQLARLTRAQAAALCGVSVKTWQRYETHEAPPWALLLMRQLSGDLGALDPAFTGWAIHQGQLFNEAGESFTPGFIQSFIFKTQQLQAQRATIRELTRQNNRLKQDAQKKTAPIEAANDATFIFKN